MCDSYIFFGLVLTKEPAFHEHTGGGFPPVGLHVSSNILKPPSFLQWVPLIIYLELCGFSQNSSFNNDFKKISENAFASHAANAILQQIPI